MCVSSKCPYFSTFIFNYFFSFIYTSVTRVFPNTRCGLRINDEHEIRPLYAEVKHL